MNLLDLALIVAMGVAAIGGWRLGLMARSLAWLGVALGLLVAVPLVAPVVGRFGGRDADTRVTVALVFLVLCSATGQALGWLLGARLHRRRPEATLSNAERAGGAGLGVGGVVVVLWMLLPSLAVAAGWPARAARDSLVVGVVEVAPAPPDVFEAWGRAIADAPFPAALGREDAPPDPGEPPDDALDATTIAQVRSSVVRVTGVACDQVLDGSGAVVEDRLVVTNAHVVAGEDVTTVVDGSGLEHAATVIAFDPIHDIALLAVPSLNAQPLTLARPEEGARAAVFGFPGGGSLKISPARIGKTIRANGTDIYRDGRSVRDVVVLAAEVVPGDSGAPVIDESGRLVALVFATDPASNDTAYALDHDELVDALGATRTPDGASTDRCVR